MESSDPPSQFSAHVMNQIQDISQRQSQRGRGRGRGRQLSHKPGNSQQPEDWSRQPPDWSNHTEHFPPLGTLPPKPPQIPQVPPGLLGPQSPQVPRVDPHFQSYPPPPPSFLYNPHEDASKSYQPVHNTSPRDFQERARGNYRRQFTHTHQPKNSTGFSFHSSFTGQSSHPNTQLYDPNTDMAYGSLQRQQQSRLKILKKQSDYLTKVGQIAYETHSLRKEEVKKKETFRQEMEAVAQAALAAAYPGLDASQVRLKCFGSLSNGFGLSGSDMDLLLALPDYQQVGSVPNLPSLSQQKHQGFEVDPDAEEHGFKVEARRILEKAFLDCGYGARLLTNTRVPILRVCSSPGPELLKNLRENRAAWEQTSSESVPEKGTSSPVESGTTRNDDVSAHLDQIENNLAGLNLTDSVNPARTARNNAKLEFTGDVGIPCDINFTNFVAVHNSTLLRLYHDFDSRVADLGFFVKVWAKAKDINTPYRGTLSSYGYILMVLHYLMNVVKPAVIPNLQALAKAEDSWHPDKTIELFEGYDIRFLRGRKEIDEARAMMTKNTQSTGELLRGFFQYYSVREGFHWTREVISIRERSGRVSKAQKGWTEAKWSQQDNRQVRLRYLLAIEDPFEVEHNVGRTVGHNGLVAIRDEFRKANALLEMLGTDAEVPLEDFLAPAANRGDTLRKDQEFHRQRQLQMKQELEAKEKGMMKVSDENPDVNADGMSGIPKQAQSRGSGCNAVHRYRVSDPKLTGNSHQGGQKKQRGTRRQRTVKAESDSEDDESKDSNTTRTESSLPDSDILLLDETNARSGVHFAPGEVKILNGFDESGHVTPWDQSTQDGRWLHWRDTKILRGTFVGVRQPSLRELHEQCPYDPRREHLRRETYAERVERELSMRPPWPSPGPGTNANTGASSQRAPMKNGSKPARSRRAEVAPRKPVTMDLKESKQNGDSESITALPTSAEDTKQLTEQELSETPNSDFIRAQRLAFFAKPESPARDAHESNSNFFLRDTHNDMRLCKALDDGPAVSVTGSEKFSSPTEHMTMPNEVECAFINSEELTFDEPPFNTALTRGVASASSTSLEPLLVPATLYPGVRRADRPREEDPNIMPIPQELGFEFDLRQLQDLDAIARGGNGCARDGATFSVEQDYELGGGGMMGYMSSTSAQQVAESESQIRYEGGKGDDEGLLTELPGPLE